MFNFIDYHFTYTFLIGLSEVLPKWREVMEKYHSEAL
jgi:membrane-bound lytic murein transglycosylase MltF